VWDGISWFWLYLHFCTCWLFRYLLWKKVYSGLLSNDMSSLCILGINTLSDMRFASISLPFLRLLFHFIDCFFHCAERCSLMWSLLFIFAFSTCAFGVKKKKKKKKSLPRPMSKNFSSVFSIRMFIVSGLTFKSNAFQVNFCA